MAGAEQERGSMEGYEVRVNNEAKSRRQPSSRFNGHWNPLGMLLKCGFRFSGSRMGSGVLHL